MDISILRSGHRIRTENGLQAEVMEHVEDGAAVRVAYLDEDGGPFGVPRYTGEEARVEPGEIGALLGAVPPSSWRTISVVLHHTPATDEEPAEYRAETLSGVPNDVIVSGGSQISSQEALEHLLGGLFLMGFSGTIIVEDSAGQGSRRYEVEVPGK